MRLSSRADTSYNLYPVVFGITPNATDPSRVTPLSSGVWNYYQWMDIKSTVTVQCNGVKYSRYVFDIYVTSTVYPEGDWIVSLNFQLPYDSLSAQITVKGTSCLPSERFDVESKRCVAICRCGLMSTEQAPICIFSGKHAYMCILLPYVNFISCRLYLQCGHYYKLAPVKKYNCITTVLYGKP